MKTFEIMFSDLNENAQREFLELLGLESAEEGNWDLIPIAICDIEEQHSK